MGEYKKQSSVLNEKGPTGTAPWGFSETNLSKAFRRRGCGEKFETGDGKLREILGKKKRIQK